MNQIATAALVGILSACSPALADDSTRNILEVQASPNEHKSIFVFLDGTANNGVKSNTNVWRLFDIVRQGQDPHVAARYIEGVGSPNNPVFGAALGQGMQEHLLQGYAFIAARYNAGDDIYVFGFSRGALEARVLAGLIAYAGMPTRDRGMTEAQLMRGGERVIGVLRNESDVDDLLQWKTWKPGDAPLLAAELRSSVAWSMIPAEVHFLGVWDTVPGSAFKVYGGKDGNCGEKIGFFKRHASGLPMISKNERYKIGSYPPIRQIVHALAADEKRSKFSPVYVCQPVDARYTKVTERWFPGAHADVGGGYSDDPDQALPGLSLRWMITALGGSYRALDVKAALAGVKSSPTGLAHWSIGDKPANTGSQCEDRDKSLPFQETDQSVTDRRDGRTAPIVINKERKDQPYPKLCSSLNKLRAGASSAASTAVAPLVATIRVSQGDQRPSQ